MINTEDNHLPNGAEEIELFGRLDFNAGLEGIEAGTTDNAVYIYFNQSYGNVNISLYNSSAGLIYNNVVDTSIQQMVIIPISAANSGTYTVVLSNANGYAEGSFDNN